MANIETALMLLKTSLGVTHSARDDYFRAMLDAAVGEFSGRGVELDLDCIEDEILLVDYVEFYYRNRDGAKAMPLNLELRIRNRKARGRAAYGTA